MATKQITNKQTKAKELGWFMVHFTTQFRDPIFLKQNKMLNVFPFSILFATSFPLPSSPLLICSCCAWLPCQEALAASEHELMVVVEAMVAGTVALPHPQHEPEK